MIRVLIILAAIIAISIGAVVAINKERRHPSPVTFETSRFKIEQQGHIALITDLKTGRTYIVVNNAGIIEVKE